MGLILELQLEGLLFKYYMVTKNLQLQIPFLYIYIYVYNILQLKFYIESLLYIVNSCLQ